MSLTQLDLYDYLETDRVPVGSLVRYMSLVHRVTGQDGAGFATILPVGWDESESKTVRSSELEVLSLEQRLPNLSLAERRRKFMQAVGGMIAIHSGTPWADKLLRIIQGDVRDVPPWFGQSLALATDDPEKISWAQSEDTIDVDMARRRGTPTAFMKYILREFGALFTDREIERFASAFLSSGAQFDWSFDVVFGDEITETFEALRDTCGEPIGCSWYAENPESVSLVRIFRDGKLYGRAMLWNVESIDSGRRMLLLDQIIPSNRRAAHIVQLMNFAREQGWAISDPLGSADGAVHIDTPAKVWMRWPSDGVFPLSHTMNFLIPSTLQVVDGVELYVVTNSLFYTRNMAASSNMRRFYHLSSTNGGFSTHE